MSDEAFFLQYRALIIGEEHVDTEVKEDVPPEEKKDIAPQEEQDAHVNADDVMDEEEMEDGPPEEESDVPLHGEHDAKDNDDIMDEAIKRKKSPRVSFLLSQIEIVPSAMREMYRNMMRSFPTSPLFLLLVIGSLRPNIAGYTAIRRLKGH